VGAALLAQRRHGERRQLRHVPTWHVRHLA
jgi:hypothetical protein